MLICRCFCDPRFDDSTLPCVSFRLGLQPSCQVARAHPAVLVTHMLDMVKQTASMTHAGPRGITEHTFQLIAAKIRERPLGPRVASQKYCANASQDQRCGSLAAVCYELACLQLRHCNGEPPAGLISARIQLGLPSSTPNVEKRCLHDAQSRAHPAAPILFHVRTSMLIH